MISYSLGLALSINFSQLPKINRLSVEIKSYQRFLNFENTIFVNIDKSYFCAPQLKASMPRDLIRRKDRERRRALASHLENQRVLSVLYKA